MSTGIPSVLILGHSFVKRLKRDLRSKFDPRTDGKFKRWGTVSVLFHGVGGYTVAKLLSSDLHVVARIAPDVLILEIGTNDLVVTSPRLLVLRLFSPIGSVNILQHYLDVVLSLIPKVFCWVLRAFSHPEKDFSLPGGVHVDPEVQYHLYRSYRGCYFSGITLALKIVNHIFCIC